jgi:regulator of replication initiation timing
MENDIKLAYREISRLKSKYERLSAEFSSDLNDLRNTLLRLERENWQLLLELDRLRGDLPEYME